MLWSRLRSSQLIRWVCLLIFFAGFASIASNANATEAEPAQLPAPILLWSQGAPGAKGTEEVDKPCLWAFPAPADKATGAAVVICPGGAYTKLATGHEGVDVARWYNSLGISAYVLKYRLAPYRHPVPMQDAQRAIRLVRSKAAEWHLDPQRIGLMGFSAGGHLASTVGTHFDTGNPQSDDPIDKVSCRPDFLILCYGAIAMSTEYAHQGSKKQLLGPEPDQALVDSLSNEKQVTAETPPTFLFHTGEDKGVPAENSVLFYMALRKAKVPAELHIYETGKHGIGMAQDIPSLKDWPERLANWLRLRGVIKSS